MSQPRSVHLIDMEAFITAAVFVCAGRQGCGRTCQSLDGDAMMDVLPDAVINQTPVKAFKKSCWSASLVNVLLDTVTSGGTISTFMSIVSHARVSSYMRCALMYQDMVDRYTKGCQRKDVCFDEFPEMLQHCGFNMSLGPSSCGVTEVLKECTNSLNPLIKRYIAGLVS